MVEQRPPGIQDTMMNMLGLIENLLPTCSCGRPQKISLICQDEQCKKRQLQTYYCLDCAQTQHKHSISNIATYFEEYEKKWDILASILDIAKQNLDEWNSKMKELIDLVITKIQGTPNHLLQQREEFPELLKIFLKENEKKAKAKMENNFDQYVCILLKIDDFQRTFDSLDLIKNGLSDITLNYAFKQILLNIEQEEMLSLTEISSLYEIMKLQLNNRLESLLGEVACPGIQSLETFSADIDRINGCILANIRNFDLERALLLRFDMLDYKWKFEKFALEKRLKEREEELGRMKELWALEVRYRCIFLSRFGLGGHFKNV
ncbi:hypothetical protein FGO68_gene5825 [Halteria grandinella]|uniref:Uncharacterized protein n=1 Tax=Halteria grandinella TaxID=5974 RepID=A0A8J8NLK3_HALGN|nr:hypothetical protein FGO68_gene5825 [Halteria grandinella]